MKNRLTKWDRLRAPVLASLAACVLATAPAQAKIRLFVPNSGDGTVSVVDTDVDREIKTITVGALPQAAAIHRDPPLLAVSNSKGNSVTLIDPVELTVLGAPIPVGKYPGAVAFSADGKQLYVGSQTDKSIYVVDVATRAVDGAPIAVGGAPLRIRLAPGGKGLLVMQYEEQGALALVDLAQRAVVQKTLVDSFPTDFVISPDGSKYYVASFKGDTLTTVDAQTMKSLGQIDFSVGNGLLIHPTKPLLYSMNTFEDRVSVYDLAQNKETASIEVGQKPAYSALTPDGRYLYALNSSDNNLSKIDTETNAVLTRVAVGVEPTDVVVFDMQQSAPSGAWQTVAGIAALGIVIIAVARIVTQRRAAA